MSASVTSPSWETETAEPLFRAAMVGAQAGADRIGASVYELGPGASTGPFHFHRANEELLIVLSGTPLLRRGPEAAEQLEPGAVAAFPAGEAGTHAIENASDEVARVLIVSTMCFPDVVEHPERGSLAVVTGPPVVGSEFILFDREAGVEVPLDS